MGVETVSWLETGQLKVKTATLGWYHLINTVFLKRCEPTVLKPYTYIEIQQTSKHIVDKNWVCCCWRKNVQIRTRWEAWRKLVTLNWNLQQLCSYWTCTRTQGISQTNIQKYRCVYSKGLVCTHVWHNCQEGMKQWHTAFSDLKE